MSVLQTLHENGAKVLESLKCMGPGRTNVRIAPGVPGLMPGIDERVDAFSAALPWEAATPDGLFTIRGVKPEAPEGLGFAVELFPQTGVTAEMEKTLIGLAAPLEAGTVMTVTAFASSAVRGIAELMVPEARTPDAFAPLSPEASSVIDAATQWSAENLVRGAVEQLTPWLPFIRGIGGCGSRWSFRRRIPRTKPFAKRS